MARLVSILTLGVLLSLAGAQVRIGVDEAVLNDFKNELGPGIVNKVVGMALPDVSEKVTILGTYKMTNMKLESLNVNFDATALDLVAPNQVKFSCNSVNGKVTFHWDHWSSGSGSITLSNANLGATLSLAELPSNELQLQVVDLSFNLNDLDVDLDGFFGKILEGFIWVVQHVAKGLIQGKVEDALKNALNSQMTKLVIDLENELVIPGLKANVDFSMLSPPRVYNNYMSLLFKSYLYTHNIAEHYPATPVVVPDYLPGVAPVQAFVGETVLDSAFWAFYHMNQNITITWQMLPKLPIAFNLTAEWIDVVFPGTIKICGNKDVPVDMKIFPKVPGLAPGKINLHPRSATGIFNVGIAFQCKALPVEVLAISTDYNFNLSVTVDERLTVKLAINKVEIDSLTQISTLLPTQPQIDQIKSLLTLLLDASVIPTVNKKLAPGIPLAIPKEITFENTKVEIKETYLAATGDPVFHV